MKRFLLTYLLAAFLLPTTCLAQWRIGISGGGDYNFYSADKQYMTDYRIMDWWGFAVGLNTRYDFFPWLGLGWEVNMTQKNHRLTRYVRNAMDYHYSNYYLQLPVMAHFSFGGRLRDKDGNPRASSVRGFANVGFYGGCWLSSRLTGTDYNHFSNPSEIIRLNQEDFNPKRDQRWDCGPVVGLGLEYQFAEHWATSLECRYYYSLINSRKHYMRVRDAAYNSTLVLQIAFDYIF